jgi:hypothetical protein
MKDYRVLLMILALITIFAAGAAHATGKRQCAEDYRRFCSQWGLETRGLENCMRRHGDQLRRAPCHRPRSTAAGLRSAVRNARGLGGTKPIFSGLRGCILAPQLFHLCAASKVRFWHLADTGADVEHVSSWGQSGHP